MMLSWIRRYIVLEANSSSLLLGMTLLALFWANTIYYPFYFATFTAPLIFHKSLLFIINDGLMTCFFLSVGLEIKREIYLGELNTWNKRLLPGIAALGGMVVPGCLYALINWNNGNALHGWGIPTATDIAFALGVLNLLAKRVPFSLKIFLTALAILDDLGAIILIACVYADTLSWHYLSVGLLICLALFLLNRLRIIRLWGYFWLAGMLWWCLLKAGIHPTLAGVILAFAIPLEKVRGKFVLQSIEQALHPWVSYFVLPLFALANAGINLSDFSSDWFANPVTLGVIAGLFIGKQVGIMGAIAISVRMHWVKLPNPITWRSLYGISLLCGIGFTMSLFISDLAFIDQSVELLKSAKFGIICASLLSGLLGYLTLAFSYR